MANTSSSTVSASVVNPVILHPTMNSTTQYVLLNPLLPEQFDLSSVADLSEAVEEFGCFLLSSKKDDVTYYYATAISLKALEQMCSVVDLSGVVLQVGGIFSNEVVEGD